MPPKHRARYAAAALAAGLIAGTAALAPSVSHAYTVGDTLTVIWRPLPSLPAFARSGDALPVWANAPSSVTGWSATLRFGTLAVPLTPAGGGYVTSRARWELDFTVPPGTPEEVYDLVLTSAGTAPDTSRHCVKVLDAYRDGFYFAQITDTHLPMHALSSAGGFNVNDTSAVADFDAVVDDLNLIHPEFVLHTGDLVNEGELEDYLGVYEMARSQGAARAHRRAGVPGVGQPRPRRLADHPTARRHLASRVVALSSAGRSSPILRWGTRVAPRTTPSTTGRSTSSAWRATSTTARTTTTGPTSTARRASPPTR